MRFSKKTLTVLDNLATISMTLRFNRQKSGMLVNINDAGSVGAFYVLPDDEKKIPEFDIYNLPQLLEILKFFEAVDGDYDITFKEELKYMRIHNKESRVIYRFLSKEICDQNEEGKNIPLQVKDLSNVEICFKITKEHLLKLNKMLSTLQYEHLSIKATSEKKVIATVLDVKDDTSNSFDLIIGENTIEDSTAEVIFDRDNLKLLPTDYDVYISSNNPGLSKWVATGDFEGLAYYIGLLIR